jgi:hypothetical protein
LKNFVQKIDHFRLFSRRHFPKEYVTYCGLDYETDRYWTYQFPDLEMLPRAKYDRSIVFFCFVSMINLLLFFLFRADVLVLFLRIPMVQNLLNPKMNVIYLRKSIHLNHHQLLLILSRKWWLVVYLFKNEREKKLIISFIWVCVFYT